MFKTLFREKLFSSYIWQLIFMNELFMLIKIKIMNKLVFIFLFLNLLIFSDNLFSQYYTNQYATLDGTDDYFSAPSHPELNLDSAFTIECWIFLKDTTGFNKTILSRANSANNSGYALLVKGANSNPGSAGRLQFNINGTNNIISQNTGTRISLNNWNHIAVTFKRGGLNISDTLRFYINGNQVTSLTRLNESIVNSSDSLRIGSCYLPGNYSNSFSGYIDDLRIYKTRRAAVYISNDRGVPVSMEGITNSGLLSNSRYASLTAAWKFDGNGNDNTGFSNNLRLNNGTSFFNSSFNPLPYRNQSNYFIKFSGTSWLAAPDSSNSSYDADTACTIEAYVYPDSAVSSDQTLISKGNNYKIGISNNRYYFSINAGSKILNSFSNIKLKQWTHIAVTYRSLTGAMNIYLNGNLDSSKIFSNGNITVTNDSLFMGRSNSGEFLFGKLDEVRISRISKTQELIKKYLYTNIDNNNGNQFSPVVNCYGFEGNTLDNVTGVKPMLIRGDAYFEWINNNSTAGGSSQAPLIRRSLSDEGFPADRSLSGFSIRNNSTFRDSIYVTASSNSFLKKAAVILSHTYMDDVDISLRSPTGITVNLTTDNGGTFNDLCTEFSDVYDSSLRDINTPFSMLIKPQSTFNVFNGINSTGYWRLTVTDDNAGNVDSGRVYTWGLTFGINTGISVNSQKLNFRLEQNYPNPFNPSTKINYSLPGLQFTVLKIYDIRGKEIQTLVNEKQSGGDYQIEFSATENGVNFPSGVYFYKLQSGNYSDTKRMILIK